ncbi:hypothetical protein FJY71_07525, partial [candidate division WOR-3 bacterium]|nr:hypothetical protein [candidate division WOR-3 bacterium]
MRRIFRPAADECVPEAAAVLAARGMPETPDEKTAVLLDEGFELFRKLAAPAGVVEDVPAGEFGLIYAGEGRNAPVSPLATVYAQADRLALFCVTVGPAVSDDIARRFDSHDYALGYVLDAVASAGAERLADLTQEQWNARRPGPEAGIALRYSPGYCGWDVTGQRRLFERLRPEEVGVTLRES